MKVFNKLKELLSSGNLKKTTANFIAIIIVCVIALISWSIFFPKDKDTVAESENMKEVIKDEGEGKEVYNDSIDKQLERILSNINGVGDVDVMITYETSTEVVPALNVTKSQQTTEEKDKQGGSRRIKQENVSENVVTVNDKDYKNSPIVIKEIKPTIRGVIVVAEGSSNPEVKNQLIDAVTTIFQIKSHKVKIYERN